MFIFSTVLNRLNNPVNLGKFVCGDNLSNNFGLLFFINQTQHYAMTVKH